ncbi:hypothetical protein JCM24511_04246 [Saitozyma sp. JCM 24511]|nr:hypothetical protein JCM24511_04246 [Saitozyma sp. JCM 24511]
MRRITLRILLGGLVGVAFVISRLTYPKRPTWMIGEPHEVWASLPIGDPGALWGWLAELNKSIRGETRRVSWGALKAQGAKASLRENLRNDRRYLMSAGSGGLTNQFMSMVNAIYLARESNRIPILLHFVGYAMQIGGPAHKLPVSDVFDLSRVSMVLDGMPIVEIHELRQHDLEQDHLKVVSFDGEFEQMDKLGRPLVPGDLIVAEPPETEALACWSWSLNHGRTAFLSGFDDVQWLPLPKNVYADNYTTESGSDFLKLARFARDANGVPQESFQALDQLNLPRPSLLPDPELFCIDDLFWYSEQPQRWDFHTEWRVGSGAWAIVGKYLRFQPALVGLADRYLRHAFGLQTRQALPPFFAVHIRRGAEHYAHAAWEALREIEAVLGIHLEHIIFTTDEPDPDWRAPLLSYGWHFVDHDAMETGDKFGHWLPTLLDNVILSRATGFLGTHGSTMSIIAMRRVIDWNGGIGRWISWGHSIPEGWKWAWHRNHQ